MGQFHFKARILYMQFRALAQTRGIMVKGPSALDALMVMGLSIGMMVLAWCFGLHRTVKPRRDRITLLWVLVAALLTTHCTHLWTLGCCYLGLEPLWPAEATKDNHPVISTVMALVFGVEGG